MLCAMGLEGFALGSAGAQHIGPGNVSDPPAVSGRWSKSFDVPPGVGWLIGAATGPVTVETICFRNGEPIDCSALPESSL
ncbi:MAG TPA: hypothetical protein VMZ31_14495 [Phycisphaerae bacterium]|nr:hypothetical protein [Phycisphaerae bacterium]